MRAPPPLQGAGSGAIGWRLSRRAMSSGFVKTLRSDLLDRAAAAAEPARARPWRRRRRRRRPAPPRRRPTEVAFSADQLIYDEQADIVTATGEVRMNREGYQSARRQRDLEPRSAARSAPRAMSASSAPSGDVAYGDSVLLEDTLRDGVVENLLLVLADGGRLAAVEARARATASPPSTAPPTRPARWSTPDGCPQGPDLADQRGPRRPRSGPPPHHLSGRDASTCSARRSSPCPASPIPTAARAAAAACSCPRFASTGATGSSSACLIISGSRPTATRRSRRTSTPSVLPMLEAEYRQLTSLGAFQIRGYRHLRLAGPDRSARCRRRGRATRASAPISRAMAASSSSPRWSVTASGRYVTDRTFMRRYDISRDDRLRSLVDAERITADSYISIAGWAFQGLRVTDVDGQQPIALPAIDARWRIADPWLGGQIELQANSLAILRPEGQDSQRAFASARWDRRSITPLGQELVLTALCPRRRLSRQRHPADPDRHLSRRGRLERPLHRRGRGRHALAVRRRASSAAPSASRRGSSSSPRRRPRISTSPTRMPARSTSRIRTCSR